MEKARQEPALLCVQCYHAAHASDHRAEHRHEETCGDSRTYNACDIGTHGVHKQIVSGFCAQAFQVGHPRRHRHCGNAGRADERIDLALAELAHQLAYQQTAHGREREGDEPEHHYL